KVQLASQRCMLNRASHRMSTASQWVFLIFEPEVRTSGSMNSHARCRPDSHLILTLTPIQSGRSMEVASSGIQIAKATMTFTIRRRAAPVAMKFFLSQKRTRLLHHGHLME